MKNEISARKIVAQCVAANPGITRADLISLLIEHDADLIRSGIKHAMRNGNIHVSAEIKRKGRWVHRYEAGADPNASHVVKGRDCKSGRLMVLEYLRQHPNSSAAELIAALDETKNKIYRGIRNAVETGQAHISENGAKPRYSVGGIEEEPELVKKIVHLSQDQWTKLGVHRGRTSVFHT